jgi:hypothetical protein
MVVRCPELCCPHEAGPAGATKDNRGPGAGTPGHEAARLFEQVIALVTGFCPGVEAVEPGVCAFGARGPARYYGGETALAGQIITAIADLGTGARVGAADGLFAALLASRGADPASSSRASSSRASSSRASSSRASSSRASSSRASSSRASSSRAGAGPVGSSSVGSGLAGSNLTASSSVSARQIFLVPPGGSAVFLAGQPVGVLEDQDLAGLLSRLGLRTLGDLAALPASDVASRFGAAGETAHRLACGLGSRPLAARPPAEDLSVVQEFDPPHPLAEPVVFAAKTLAERMHDGLAARGLTCVRVRVQATWADGRESRRLWRHDGLLSAAGVADRVRWQLDGWRGRLDSWHKGPDATAAHRGADEPSIDECRADYAWGGIAALRLVPEQVVRATGYQLALWGETVVSGPVARAAMRVQAMLGHEAVLRPVRGGGRDVSEQVTHVPFGERREPRLDGGQPWPGRIMGPAPGVVYPFAREAEVTDDAGDAVTVTGRCVVSAAPAWLAAGGEPPLRITGWAGPWPLSERWWDPVAARRRARFQLLTDDGQAWLAAVQDGRWLIEAVYR